MEVCMYNESEIEFEMTPFRKKFVAIVVSFFVVMILCSGAGYFLSLKHMPVKKNSRVSCVYPNFAAWQG